MIPSTDTGRELRGNLTGQKIGLTLDAGAAEHLMGVLTDLYEDRELAVLREYATNARDSHIAAGQSKPIEVEVPTSLRPLLVVRDFGLGLSADDLEQVYTRYGASTKRGTNDATGMLGLGCKSALAYTDQFTLIATKDGERVQASVTRNERGAGELTIVRREPTDAENGVEIQVPAARANRFAAKAADLFSYWPEGSVLVNSKAPERVEGIRLSDRLLIATTDDRTPNRHRIVMGGVPYPAQLDIKLPINRRLVAFVDIGEVHFTPSREALLDTPTTQRTLEALAHEYATALPRAISREVEQAPTRPDALARLAAFRELNPSAGLRWRGQHIPEAWKGEAKSDGTHTGAWLVPPLLRGGYTPENHTVRRRPLEPYRWAEVVWVEGFEPKNFTAVHRRKLNAWAGDAGFDSPPEFLLLRGKVPGHIRPWLRDERVLEWSELRARRVSAPSGGNQRSGQEYDQLPVGRISADALAVLGTPVYYFPVPRRTQRWGPDYGERQRGQVKTLLENEPTAICVQIPMNRLAKFQRLVPKARDGEAAVKLLYDKWREGLSEAQLRSLDGRANSIWIASLDPAKVDDPDLARAIREARESSQRQHRSVQEATRAWTQLGFPTTAPEWKGVDALKPYPMIPTGSYCNLPHDHVYLYVNAVYAANNEGS